MSNYGPVNKMKNHTVFYDGQEYRRYTNDGYNVLYPVNNGKVNYSKSIVEHRLIYEIANGVKLDKNTQIHHINHDRSDNRPENLVALSVSEHTLLHEIEKGHHIGPHYCSVCGKEISHSATMCKRCAAQKRRNKNAPNKEELAKHIKTMNNRQIGEMYGVSAQTVAVWRKRFDLPSSKCHKGVIR